MNWQTEAYYQGTDYLTEYESAGLERGDALVRLKEEHPTIFLGYREIARAHPNGFPARAPDMHAFNAALVGSERAQFRQRRKDLGLTRDQLAALCGVGRDTIRKSEGVQRLPTTTEQRIASILTVLEEYGDRAASVRMADALTLLGAIDEALAAEVDMLARIVRLAARLRTSRDESGGTVRWPWGDDSPL